MKLSSPYKLFAISIAILSLLCMQLALASYVCPASNAGAPPMVAMEDCEGMDRQQTALCHAHAHDQASKQTLDKPDLPQVGAFIATHLRQILVPAILILAHDTSALASQRDAWAAPDIAVRHCCWRI